MYHFIIDQAGKIEETNLNTVLAFHSNEIQYSILIPSKLKQELFSQCYKKYKNKLTYRIFSYCISLLLRNKLRKDSLIVIDDEYPKHGRDIKSLLIHFLKLEKDCIIIDNIGRKSKAHRIANQTFSGKLKPNKILSKKELNLKKILSRKQLRKLLK